MAESSTGRHGEAVRGIARGLTHYGDPDRLKAQRYRILACPCLHRTAVLVFLFT